MVIPEGLNSNYFTISKFTWSVLKNSLPALSGI